MKVCSVCEQTKELDKFYRRPDGRCRQPCKSCYPQSQSKWRENNIEKRRAYDRERRPAGSPHRWTLPEDPVSKRDHYYKRTYGISLERYSQILKSQDYKCAICRLPESKISRKNGLPMWLCIDHDHTCCPGTKSCGDCVRGLLCHLCNTGLGKFRDNALFLANAAKYVKGDPE